MIKVTNIRKATLNEETHTYTDANGIEARLSVSSIAQRGGIKYDSKALRTAAEAGRAIHLLMHKIITKNTDKDGVVSFASCIEMAKSTVINQEEGKICIQYFKLLEELQFNKPVVTSECSLIADLSGVAIGGTADLIIQDGGVLYILDFKTCKIGGFKKEHHLQLYGYSLFHPESNNIKCYTVHVEGIKPLFDNPIPSWIPSQFEDNFLYLIGNKKDIKLPTNRATYINESLKCLEVLRERKYQFNNELKSIESQEKTIMDNLAQCIGGLGLEDNTIYEDGSYTIEKTKSRRHYLSYDIGLDKYYKCSETDEYHLTYQGKKVKIKINGKNNGEENE